mmetsp:Transcript_5834/g.11025  ORF Transcript_5834/g.11025 Transcript_5834/m.11025 type:complete len:298 (-) Transcript_5834:101-994(-)
MLKFASFSALWGFALAGTPTELIGDWRGMMIQADEELNEWDFSLNSTHAIIQSVTKGITHCEVDSTDTTIAYTFLDGDASGSTMNCYWALDQTGEVTTSALQACEGPGHPLKISSIDDAMSGHGPVVNMMVKCNSDSACDFSGAMPSMGESTSPSAPKGMRASADDDLTGIWRGIGIQNGFTNDEFDFTFNSDGTVYFKNINDASATVADVTLDNGSIELAVTSSDNAADVGQSYKGIYSNNEGMETKYMYMALGALGGDAPSDYESGLDSGNNQFVLWACADSSSSCTFENAKVSA